MFKIQNKGQDVNLRSVYTPSSQEVDSYCKEASTVFKTDKKSAVILYQTAFNVSSEPLDDAYVLRRLASTIMASKEKSELDIVNSKKFLKNSFGIYEKVNIKNLIVKTEKQRVLALLCKVNMDLKDGGGLERSASYLYESTLDVESSEKNYRCNLMYRIDSLNYLYHVNACKDHFSLAKKNILEIIDLEKELGKTVSTQYRHLAKIHLLQAEKIDFRSKEEKSNYFKKEIEDLLWKSVDEHKKEFYENNGYYCIEAIEKDMNFLFSFRIIEGYSVDHAYNKTIKAIRDVLQDSSYRSKVIEKMKARKRHLKMKGEQKNPFFFRMFSDMNSKKLNLSYNSEDNKEEKEH